jgi:hypothetical protein
MNRRNALGTSWRNRKKKLVHGQSVYIFILLVVFMCGQRSASGQVAESGEKQHPSLWAGGGASLYYVQYGEQKLVGATGFVDADSANGIGVEGEGRWLEFHQFAQVHAETYLVGPRYHIDINRFQPYIKGMVGAGDFNFPYNYARGTYLIVAGGGGVDYRLNHRWSVRLADVEYQSWPQFTFGTMTSVGLTSGVRFRIF